MCVKSLLGALGGRGERGRKKPTVPAPTAMPKSAWASAGESLIPSPTIATTFLLPCSSFTLSALLAGRTSANTSVMPTLAAIACAVRRLSPVTIHTPIFIFFSFLTTSTACC